MICWKTRSVVAMDFVTWEFSWMSTGSAAAQSSAANVIIFHLSPFSHLVQIRARDIRKSNNIFRNLDFHTPCYSIYFQFIFFRSLWNWGGVSRMCKWTIPSFIFCNSRLRRRIKVYVRAGRKLSIREVMSHLCYPYLVQSPLKKII